MLFMHEEIDSSIKLAFGFHTFLNKEILRLAVPIREKKTIFQKGLMVIFINRGTKNIPEQSRVATRRGMFITIIVLCTAKYVIFFFYTSFIDNIIYVITTS